MRVHLLETQTVFITLKHLRLVHLFHAAPPEVPLSLHDDAGAPLPVLPQTSRLPLVRVVEDDYGKPDVMDHFVCQGVEGGVVFQVFVFQPVVPPVEVDLEL